MDEVYLFSTPITAGSLFVGGQFPKRIPYHCHKDIRSKRACRSLMGGVCGYPLLNYSPVNWLLFFSGDGAL